MRLPLLPVQTLFGGAFLGLYLGSLVLMQVACLLCDVQCVLPVFDLRSGTGRELMKKQRKTPGLRITARVTRTMTSLLSGNALPCPNGTPDCSTACCASSVDRLIVRDSS